MDEGIKVKATRRRGGAACFRGECAWTPNCARIASVSHRYEDAVMPRLVAGLYPAVDGGVRCASMCDAIAE
jgi:hypothetical protein